MCVSLQRERHGGREFEKKINKINKWIPPRKERKKEETSQQLFGDGQELLAVQV